MKILLFLSDKIVTYSLPALVSGSYSFDVSKDEESKLINIEARDNKWVIYSTDDSFVVYDNKKIEYLPLISGKYYRLNRYNKEFIVYVIDQSNDNISTYQYSSNLSLKVGNTDDCNFKIINQYTNGIVLDFKLIEKRLFLTQSNVGVYINNRIFKGTSTYINIGDTINLFGVGITFLDKMFIVVAPKESIIVNQESANIGRFEYKPENYKSLDIKEIDLYDKSMYFTKSPRLRRQIEEKEYKIDLPPKPRDGDRLPFILTIGPMLSMGVTSMVTLINGIVIINNSEDMTWGNSWLTLVPSMAILLTTLFWPLITRYYNKHIDKVEKKKLVEEYCDYLEKKQVELEKEALLETSILKENLITTDECLRFINYKRNGFWDKRIEQNDFLEVRVGRGDTPLRVNINIQEDGFTIEEDYLKEEALKLKNRYSKLESVPIGYSFYENYITAIMGLEKLRYGFMNNIVLQLVTYYCYDEVKFVVFTNEENESKWDYLRYSGYCFNNSKTSRFFATNLESGERLSQMLNPELLYRVSSSNKDNKFNPFKPYYIVVVDDYTMYKKIDFLKNLSELDRNIGYSLIVLESALNKLPSKCLNFINLAEGKSGILKNSFDKQEIVDFIPEINYSINMMEVMKVLSNIPIEIEQGASQLPEAITFMDMEKIGKVEQLNVLNRWKSNDSTKSLKAEIGVDEEGNLLCLDLHEKYHGPHGLIAGMTGSGKSEFIITYILSMCINYSPEDVSFVLIDYKGGGLAFAFENKTTGVVLPHLAGTITNLDKSEMNRTLTSIDSEVKRRQAEFNKARDKMGESTIDIYKYQRFYHEGKLDKPIPHLFIISDEFAELKSQQPDFMDNLISIARIGRSLGVHLILATQKPSGVVNEQIWSNSKFKVCLKVQDEVDSREMLKRGDAASLKQTGRFYLQVGFDEYFVLGQSGWCGAKYFPSEKLIKQADKSINIIDEDGAVIKSVKSSNNQVKVQAEGEQLSAILGEIISVAQSQNMKVDKLWLDNVPPIVLVDDLIGKYNITFEKYNPKAIIGEYDAPERQEQGLVMFDLLKDGNTIIYGYDGVERENLLSSVIYSTTKNYSNDELNIYTIDYGSESLRSFMALPHVGDMVFAGEEDKYKNLYKMLKNEINERKKLFVNYGGEYTNYINNSNDKKPVIMVIINNYDSLFENIQDVYEELPEIIRDSNRYGIVYILTANAYGSVNSKLGQNFPNVYTLHMKDNSDYYSIFSKKSNISISNIPGRGLYETDEVHEYQTASIVEDSSKLNNYLIEYVNEQKMKYPTKAPVVPTMPEHVDLEYIKKYIKGLNSLPVGIGKYKLDTKYIDLLSNRFYFISANKIETTISFVRSIIKELNILNNKVILVDSNNMLFKDKELVTNYYSDNFDEVSKVLDTYLNDIMASDDKNDNPVIIFMGVDKYLSKLSNPDDLNVLFTKIKKSERVSVIGIESYGKIRPYMFEVWYNQSFDSSFGIWLGTGMSDQNVFKNSTFNKDMAQEYSYDMGFYVYDGISTLSKFLDFYYNEMEVDEDE